MPGCVPVPSAGICGRTRAGQVTIGIGGSYVAGWNADFAIAAGGDDTVGHGAPDADCPGRDGDDLRDLTTRAARAYASVEGRFMTTRQIADRVAPGEFIGAIGDVPVVASIGGALRGLTARARVREGDLVVEIDPRGDPAGCLGWMRQRSRSRAT